MKAFRFVLFPIALLASFLSGCSSAGISAIESISVRLVELKTGDDGRPVVTIGFVNASVLPIAVSTTETKVYLNGAYVGDAKSEKPLGLPAAAAANQDIPLVLKGTLPASGTASYRLETSLLVLAGEERLRTRTRAEGTVTVP